MLSITIQNTCGYYVIIDKNDIKNTDWYKKEIMNSRRLLIEKLERSYERERKLKIKLQELSGNRANNLTIKMMQESIDLLETKLKEKELDLIYAEQKIEIQQKEMYKLANASIALVLRLKHLLLLVNDKVLIPFRNQSGTSWLRHCWIFENKTNKETYNFYVKLLQNYGSNKEKNALGQLILPSEKDS